MTMTDIPRDEKAGWSSWCRRDAHDQCDTVGAICTCPHHGGPVTARTGAPPVLPGLRRMWSDDDKRRIVAEAAEHGRAATLKKYRLAGSVFSKWKVELAQGATTAPGPATRPALPSPAPRAAAGLEDPVGRAAAHLRGERDRLAARLAAIDEALAALGRVT